jgi:hypothetical protein
VIQGDTASELNRADDDFVSSYVFFRYSFSYSLLNVDQMAANIKFRTKNDPNRTTNVK